jgi:hypothetical protein
MSPICRCGCGETTGGGLYLPGHDQKLRAAIEARVGGLDALARLVDSAEAYATGDLSLDALGARVHGVFEQQ